jgi:LysM repeat protein
MLLSLTDYRRPQHDNGRGVHGSALPGWSGTQSELDAWVAELQALGIKWFKLLDDNGNSLPLCRKLIAAGIFPVVRIVRRDPPPNDTPEPNPGHLNAAEEQTIKRLIDVGVLYFETNSEPDLSVQWKNGAIPLDVEEAAKLVALNWLFDARFILDAGGYPGLPAISVGSNFDLMGALTALGRQNILLEGCWIALHNYGLNHPLDYPNDPANQNGEPLLYEQYDLGPLNTWGWWNFDKVRPDPIDDVNHLRTARKNSGASIMQDHACFREYEYYNALAKKYLGRSIPILSTEGGYQVGRRPDLRYPRITPQMHADLTVALFDHMQRTAPDYYFACMPWLLVASPGMEPDAWYGDFWARAFKNGPRGVPGIPPFPVPGFKLGANLPVVDAVKAMPNIPRVALPPPSPLPVSTSARMGAHTGPGAGRAYIIERGDTLAGIARKFGTTVTAVARANNIADPSRILIGQRLIIPPTSVPPRPPPLPPVRAPRPAATIPSQAYYMVQEGDTLETIARQFAIPMAALVQANNLDDPNQLAAGRRLVIPVSGAIAAPQPSPSSQKPAPPPPPPVSGNASQFDPRLGALGVQVLRATIISGLWYWKLVRAVYVDPAQSHGEQNIYYTVLDENGTPLANQRVIQMWGESRVEALTDTLGLASIPLSASYSPDRGESGPYSAFVDGMPSDRVTGLGLPLSRAVIFRLTWQRTVK